MKGYISLLKGHIIILLMMICHLVFAQNSDNELSQLEGKVDKILSVNELFNGDAQLHPFTSETAIYGLVISGEIELNSESSLVRVVLIGNQNNEYLVYEAYLLLTDSMSFTVNERCEETCRLNNTIQQVLEIEIMDASLQLIELLMSEDQVDYSLRVIHILQLQQESKIIEELLITS